MTWTYDDGNGNTSTQTQNMTITDGVDVSIINLNDTLTVAEVGATYQWIDCDNGNQAIPGETNQSFAPTAPGNYAVEVSNGTCTATSECVFAGNAGLNSVVNANGLEIYPNPSAGDFNVAIDGLNADNLTIEVSAVNGQIIASNDYGKVMGTTKVVLDLDVEAGTYFVRISADGETVTERIIVQ